MLTPVVEVRTPVLQGTIEWRVLVVYRLDPAAVLDLIPAPFEAQVVNGFAVGAIALSKLTDVRPPGLPALLGVTVEHAAHLFAVKWRSAPSRGRRLHPEAAHQLADDGPDRRSSVPGRVRAGRLRSRGATVEAARRVSTWRGVVDAAVHSRSGAGDEVNGSELFAFTVEASLLFRRGAVGYSLRRKGGVLDGVEMRTRTWNRSTPHRSSGRSSYFDDLTGSPRSPTPRS